MFRSHVCSFALRSNRWGLHEYGRLHCPCFLARTPLSAVADSKGGNAGTGDSFGLEQVFWLLPKSKAYILGL